MISALKYKNQDSTRRYLAVTIIQLLLALALSFYLVLTYSSKFTVEYGIKIIENKNSFQGEIYYTDNDIFKEHKKKAIKYKKILNKFQKVKIEISHYNLTSLRLDPLLNRGVVEIKNFIIKFRDQTYKIDFQNFDTNYKKDIELLAYDLKSIRLRCTGSDPHIEIARNLNFNHSNFTSVIITTFLTFPLFILFQTLVRVTHKYTFDNVLLITILLSYSIYVVLFSTWQMGKYLLYIYAFTSIAFSLNNRFSYKANYIKQMMIFLVVYIAMSYASIFCTTHLADINYLNSRVLILFLACFIPLVFYRIISFDMNFFKVSLSGLQLLMTFFIISLNLELFSIDNIRIFGLLMERSEWTQKNYAFWYILLTFGTLSFYNFKDKNEAFIIAFILLLSHYTIFNTYSHSARMALIVGTVFYLTLAIFNPRKKYLHLFICFLTIFIIFSPLMFSLFDLSAYHQKLVIRDSIYHTSVALIKKHWLFGYGFGSTLQLHSSDFLNVSELPKNFVDRFPGGHPHNLSLLFWLEFGIIGAIFLAYFVLRFLRTFIEQTHGYLNQPALFAMIIAFVVITSFSWSILYYPVLLTFSFFGIMSVLSMNNEVRRDQGSK